MQQKFAFTSFFLLDNRSAGFSWHSWITLAMFKTSDIVIKEESEMLQSKLLPCVKIFNGISFFICY